MSTADRIGRREFIVLLGGAAAAWPGAARGQQSGKLPTIGFLSVATGSASTDRVGAFVRRLRELGWVEGHNVVIEYRWGEGRAERYTEIAAEFVRLKVDVIVTSGPSAIVAVKQATSVIPIVFAAMEDPVGEGLVASLARPGGNLTGLSVQGPDVAGKRVELLREMVPGLRQLAILVATNRGLPREAREVETAAGTLGIEATTFHIQRAEDIAPVFDTINGHAQALYVVQGPFVGANRHRINTLALGARMPTVHANRENVEVGGLMSYGPNFPDLFRRAGDYVDKILRGAKPADLPVEQPIKFDLVINLITAKALGLAVPPMLLARADEVIE